MVRKYKRKTEKRDPELLKRAVAAMKLGMSLRAAAREFEIPRSTLLLHRRNNTTAETANTEEENVLRASEIDLSTLTITTKERHTVRFKRLNRYRFKSTT